MTTATDFDTDYAVQSEELAADLALIQADIAAITPVNADASKAEIESRLGYLYQQAEQTGDTAAMTTITETWQQAAALAESNNLLFGAAVSAVLSARTAEQNHEQLIQDLENLNQDNQLIFNMVELVTEDVMEDLDGQILDARAEAIEETEDEAYFQAREIVFDEIIIELESICNISNFAARQFASVIMGGSVTRKLEASFWAIGEAIEHEIGLADDRGDILT